LFGIITGLVTDTGGALSHAAVVAREFGVPAVVGTHTATQRLRDGQVIELNGTTGEVKIL
jgi:phosphoenolpyruvate-protein kinase (PTS system EI component)